MLVKTRVALVHYKCSYWFEGFIALVDKYFLGVGRSFMEGLK